MADKLINPVKRRYSPKKAVKVSAGTKIEKDSDAIAMLLTVAGKHGYSAQIRSVIHKKKGDGEKHFWIHVEPETESSDGLPLKENFLKSIEVNVNSTLKEENTDARIKWIPAENKFICVPEAIYKKYVGANR